MKKLILGLLHLTRPAEWSKTFGNMAIAALLAKSMGLEDWTTFLIAFIAAGPLLWGGLYALNDWTDREKDKKHNVKKCRPIPSGIVPHKTALVFSLLLIASSFAIAFFLLGNIYFTLCLAAMLLNQCLYTMKPFNLKKIVVLDMISGSLINPFFRFFAGWTLFQQNFNAPLPLLVFTIALQFSGYSLYRLSAKEHEKELGYKSSIVILPENAIKIMSYIATAIGGLSFVYATLVGILPFRFIWLVIFSVLAFPLYYPSLVHPTKMNLREIYKLTYFHYIAFIAGFIALSYVSF